VAEQSTDLKIRANDIVRFVLEIVAFGVLCAWGFIVWPFPWNIVIGILAPVLAMGLWALFLSPKAVFSLDLFVRAIIEIIVMASAAFAWWDLGQPVVAFVFLIVAAVSGTLNGRRQIG